MEFKRYFLHEDESELREIEKDLALYLQVPFVRCDYDSVNSHKCQDKDEIIFRNREVKGVGNKDMTSILDYIINYEKYETKEDYEKQEGGYDGEVYELLYLKGNGNYIVITGIAE